MFSRSSQAQINISRDMPFIDMLLLSLLTRSSVRKASPGYTPVHTVVTLILCHQENNSIFRSSKFRICVAKKAGNVKLEVIRYGGQHDELRACRGPLPLSI